MHDRYLDQIKAFEGYAETARWDYAQHSNGYGTRALYPGERITPAEAEKRFAAEIAKARVVVERQASGWDEGTKAALTSLTYNAGTAWVTSGLGDAVRRGDAEAVKDRFLAYNKAGGEVLPGLVRRRAIEAQWIGDELARQTQPTHAYVATYATAALNPTVGSAISEPAESTPGSIVSMPLAGADAGCQSLPPFELPTAKLLALLQALFDDTRPSRDEQPIDV